MGCLFWGGGMIKTKAYLYYFYLLGVKFGHEKQVSPQMIHWAWSHIYAQKYLIDQLWTITWVEPHTQLCLGCNEDNTQDMEKQRHTESNRVQS